MTRIRVFQCARALALGTALAFDAVAFAQTDPLPTWSGGAAKARIVGFVRSVTEQGGKDYVPPADRVAVFDNDGTLWSEQPAYFQLLFAIDRVKALAPRYPEWKTQQPFKAMLDRGLDEGPKRGWTIVIMNREWRVIYPAGKR